MSRQRTRPTREETRDRLLRAAAQVFSDKGIGNSSIEDICDEAGFSRGAFYSNFAAKDELVIELLDMHIASSHAAIDELYESSTDTLDFVENMESDRRQRDSPLDVEDGGLLYIELLLYSLRNPDNRPKLLGHQQQMRESNVGVLERIVEAVGRPYPMPLEDLASIIMAVDIGLSLNNFVDPESARPTQFSEFMGLLHRMWLATPPGSLDD